jgi:hypothetical protein
MGTLLRKHDGFLAFPPAACSCEVRGGTYVSESEVCSGTCVCACLSAREGTEARKFRAAQDQQERQRSQAPTRHVHTDEEARQNQGTGTRTECR